MIYPIRKYLIWWKKMNKYINNLFADLGIFLPIFAFLTALEFVLFSVNMLTIGLSSLTIISIISNFYYLIVLKKIQDKEPKLISVSELKHSGLGLVAYIYMGIIFMTTLLIVGGVLGNHSTYIYGIFFCYSILSIFFFNFYVMSWMVTKGEVNIGLIPLVRVLYPYSYEAIEDSFPIRSIFIVSKEVVQNNTDCKMYSVDENGRKVFLFGYRTYKTK